MINCKSNSDLYNAITALLPLTLFAGGFLGFICILDLFRPETIHGAEVLFRSVAAVLVLITIFGFVTLRLTRSQRQDIQDMLDARD
mgnify:CR=1 FL=1